MNRSGKRVSLADVERVFEYGGHRSGSADRKIHERFLDDVVHDRMEPDALIFYGLCLEVNDVKYIRPWLDAIQRLIDSDPSIAARIRLRQGQTINNFELASDEAAENMRHTMRVLGELLRNDIPPEHGQNPRLDELVKRFNCSCS